MRGGDLGLHQFLVERFGDALVRGDQDFLASRVLDLVRKLAVDQALRKDSSSSSPSRSVMRSTW